MKKSFVLISILLLSQFFAAVPSSAENTNDILINASSNDELIYRVREFVFEELDNQETEFAVTITGSALDEYTYNYILKSKTEFEAQLIGEYMRTPGKDYNSLILREYTISKTVWNSAFNLNGVTKLKLSYKIKWDETKEDKEFVKTFAETKVKDLIKNDDSDYQKIKTLHDYVVNNYSYDMSETNEIHNPSQMIREKTGVCSAYTGLMNMLLAAAGIESRIILIDATAENGGSKQCHTWNLVKLNNCWYHLDATWDDPVFAGMMTVKSYDYFLISDNAIQNDHSWDTTVYPAAEFNYSKDSMVMAFTSIPDNVDEKTSISLNKAAQATFQSLCDTALFYIIQPELWLVLFSSLFIVLLIFRLLELKFH